MHLPNIRGFISASWAFNAHGWQGAEFLLFLPNDRDKLFWAMLNDFAGGFYVFHGLPFFILAFSANEHKHSLLSRVYFFRYKTRTAIITELHHSHLQISFLGEESLVNLQTNPKRNSGRERGEFSLELACLLTVDSSNASGLVLSDALLLSNRASWKIKEDVTVNIQQQSCFKRGRC